MLWYSASSACTTMVGVGGIALIGTIAAVDENEVSGCRRTRFFLLLRRICAHTPRPAMMPHTHPKTTPRIKFVFECVALATDVVWYTLVWLASLS